VVKSTSRNANKVRAIGPFDRDRMTEKPASRRNSSPVPPGTMIRGIFLVGFMGAGKTSVGRRLAERLGWRFVDLDQHIEAQEGLPVPEIFRRYEESGFRDREHRALSSLMNDLNLAGPAVVGLGGGTFVQPSNLSLLSSMDTPTIFLDAPVEELWQRCTTSGEPERPLRRDETSFRTLHEQRRAHYLRSSWRVETAGKRIEQIAEEVIAVLGISGETASEEKAE